MIRNLWSITKICCGCHEEPIAMRLQNGPKSEELCLQYIKPLEDYDKKYHGEKGCPNRVSTEIVEQILDILGEKIEEAEQKGEEINLTNYRFTHKMVECVVLSHSPFSLKISLKNKRAFLH